MNPVCDNMVFAVCFYLMAVAVIADMLKGKIPNALTIPTMIAGLAFHMLRYGWAGAEFSFQGLAAGMGLLVLPFILGGMGGGDVKLLGAAGAWLGPMQVCAAGLWGMFFGGMISMVIMVRQTGLRHAGRIPFQLYHSLIHENCFENESRVTYPYALPLAMGYIVYGGLAPCT